MSQNDPDQDAPAPVIDGESMKALLHDVPLELAVELGRVTLNLGELAARLGPGSIIPLNKSTGEKLDVRVNGRLVARAEAVAVGERCGIRIVEIVSNGENE
ncbi:MAG TPA: FliM/FliN family flagellar motor switch protein [Kofleriaceae bacterium]|nr:FliM/FliN family flagellar motor switch protein [Kofleriaceae bacterium]